MPSRRAKRIAVPLELRWETQRNPLPVRIVQGHIPRLQTADIAPPWWHTGSIEHPFDFSGHMQRLIAGIAERSPTFQHIDPNRLLIGFTQARNERRFGLQARVTPLRFNGGELCRRHRGTPYQVQRYFVDETEILYVVSFCLPRFLNQDFDDKMVTLFHELYHISPKFDGDLRRHEGRYAVHTSSQKRYDEQMAELAREYLQSRPNTELHDFLRLNFGQLCHRHRSIAAISVPRPKVVPIR